VIAYRAMLDVPRELVGKIAGLLRCKRRAVVPACGIARGRLGRQESLLGSADDVAQEVCVAVVPAESAPAVRLGRGNPRRPRRLGHGGDSSAEAAPGRGCDGCGRSGAWFVGRHGRRPATHTVVGEQRHQPSPEDAHLAVPPAMCASQSACSRPLTRPHRRLNYRSRRRRSWCLRRSCGASAVSLIAFLSDATRRACLGTRRWLCLQVGALRVLLVGVEDLTVALCIVEGLALGEFLQVECRSTRRCSSVGRATAL